MAETSSGGLERSIPRPLLILYALGTTLGAGIFVVIGEIIGAAGQFAPLSFALAALVAGLTGASFAELSARMPSSGGPVAWADKAFGVRWLPAVLGWAIVVTGTVSAATIATGFVRYAGEFVDWPKQWVLPVLVGVPTLIAAIGIKPTAWFMAVMTSAGLIGLGIVLGIAGANMADWPARAAAGVAGGTMTVVPGVLIGGFLAFYAFIGFEDLAHLGDEAKGAERAVPQAIFATLAISLLLYLAVSMTALGTLSAERLAASRAPLIDVVRASGWAVVPVAALSLVTIADGLLAQLVMITRTVHDLGKRRGAPRALGKVSAKTKTPFLATLVFGGAILALALFFETRSLAAATSTVILIIFAVTNATLIRVKQRDSGKTGTRFTVPRWLPWIALASCLALLAIQPFTGGGG